MIRDLWPDGGVRGVLRSSGRLTARGVSIALFVVLLGATAIVSATASGVGLAVTATFLSFYLLKTVVPDDRLDELTTQLWTGEAGIRAYQWLAARVSAIVSLIPGVGR